MSRRIFFRMRKSIRFNFGFLALCRSIWLFSIVILARIGHIFCTSHFICVLFRSLLRVLYLGRSFVRCVIIRKTAKITFCCLPLYGENSPVSGSSWCFRRLLISLFNSKHLSTVSTATDIPLYASLHHGFLGDFLNLLGWFNLFSSI